MVATDGSLSWRPSSVISLWMELPTLSESSSRNLRKILKWARVKWHGLEVFFVEFISVLVSWLACFSCALSIFFPKDNFDICRKHFIIYCVIQ